MEVFYFELFSYTKQIHSLEYKIEDAVFYVVVFLNVVLKAKYFTKMLNPVLNLQSPFFNGFIILHFNSSICTHYPSMLLHVYFISVIQKGFNRVPLVTQECYCRLLCGLVY